MKLTKNYRLLRFLNQRHGVISRLLFGLLCWGFTILTTGKLRLASSSFKIIWSDNFRLGMRQLHWYAKRSWLNYAPIDDRFFDFTAELTKDELVDQANFLKHSLRKQTNIEVNIDELYILAAKAHLALRLKDVAEYKIVAKKYIDVGNQILSNIAKANPDKDFTLTKKTNVNVFSKIDASNALRDFANIFPATKMRWFIGSGTFLGAVREGDWLSHDLDIDLGIHNENLDLSFTLEALQNNSNFDVQKLVNQISIELNVKNEPTLHERPTLIKLIHKSGINVDLFIHYLENDIRWHGSIVHRWDNTDFDLGNYKLAGINVLGPKNSDLYLSENYGIWRVPVIDYNCTTGPPNLSVVRNLTSIALFLRRISLHFEKGENEQVEFVLSKLQISGVITKKNNEYKMQPDFLFLDVS